MLEIKQKSYNPDLDREFIAAWLCQDPPSLYELWRTGPDFLFSDIKSRKAAAPTSQGQSSFQAGAATSPAYMYPPSDGI